MKAEPRIRVKNAAAPVMPSQPAFEIEPTTGNASARWVRQLTNATISTTRIARNRMKFTQLRIGHTNMGPWSASNIPEDYPGGYRLMRSRPGSDVLLGRGRTGLLGRLGGRLGLGGLGRVGLGLGRDLGHRRLGVAGTALDHLLAAGDQVGVERHGLLLRGLPTPDERPPVAPGHRPQPVDVQLGRAGTVPQLGHLGRQGTQLVVSQVAGAGRGVERSRVLPRGLLGRGGHWVSSGFEATVRAAFFTGLFGVSGVADGASGTGSVSFADSRAFSRRNVS